MGYSGRNHIYEATIRRMVSEALAAEDEAFRMEHSQDLDGELLAYLRQCSAELGHTPWPREIPGGALIERRFDTWENALTLAELPMPTGPDRLHSFARFRQEHETQQARYRQRKAEKKRLAEERLARRMERKSVDPD